jgi:hypothetical protein
MKKWMSGKLIYLDCMLVLFPQRQCSSPSKVCTWNQNIVQPHHIIETEDVKKTADTAWKHVCSYGRWTVQKKNLLLQIIQYSFFVELYLQCVSSTDRQEMYAKKTIVTEYSAVICKWYTWRHSYSSLFYSLNLAKNNYFP